MTSFEQRRKVRSQQSSLVATPARNKATTQTIATPTLTGQTIQRARSMPDVLRPADVLQLQSSIGNIAVGNLLGRNQSQGAQPGVVQRTPLSNTIQRDTDDDVSEDYTDDTIDNPIDNPIDNTIEDVFTDDTDDDFEDEEADELEEDGDTPTTDWSTDEYYKRQYSIPSKVPDYQSSPTAIRKKIGLRRRLWNKVAHRGALALDRARNKATGGSGLPLTNRVEAKEGRQYLKVDKKLKSKHYESYLSRKDRKRFRKQRGQENQGYALEQKLDKKNEKKMKEMEKDAKWISDTYRGGGGSAVSF